PQAQSERAALQDFPTNEELPVLSGPVGAIFVGDSITAEYLYGLTPMMKQLGISYDAKAGAGCLNLYGVTLAKPLRRAECLLARDETLKWLEGKTQPVIYTQNWRQYDDSDIELDGAANASNEKGALTKLQEALDMTIGRIGRQRNWGLP